MVEDNNDLVQAEREEETEILRVLAALTDAVHAALPELERLVDGHGRAATSIFARAELAERMEAVEPVVADEREVDVRGARHPLLLAQGWAQTAGRGRGAAGPAIRGPGGSHRLDAERPLLVITGPNAGGKTVALKTLGLLAVMAQAGLHVPALPGARLPRLHPALRHHRGRPERGGEPLDLLRLRQAAPRGDRARGRGAPSCSWTSWARAPTPTTAPRWPRRCWRSWRSAGALCAASTHLEPLKGFASTHPRARNASVEFDRDRLEPDVPAGLRPARAELCPRHRGAARPAAAPDRARAGASLHPAGRLQELIARLDARDRQEAERVAQLEQREAESAARLRARRGRREAARADARATP